MYHMTLIDRLLIIGGDKNGKKLSGLAAAVLILLKNNPMKKRTQNAIEKSSFLQEKLKERLAEGKYDVV